MRQYKHFDRTIPLLQPGRIESVKLFVYEISDNNICLIFLVVFYVLMLLDKSLSISAQDSPSTLCVLILASLIILQILYQAFASIVCS